MDVDGDRFYLRKHYSEAIFHAGGIPVLVPLIAEKDYVQGLVRRLDAIVLSGSNSDVDPHRYGEEPHLKIGSVMSRRDQTDLYLLEEVFQDRKPLLAICFGIQILNVFLGGTLWQDIDSQVKGAVKHCQQGPEEYKSHTVKIKLESLLFALAAQDEFRVNSYHHQAIQEVASSLDPVAKAKDGIVEAVELREKNHFVLGVQWHPEIGWEKDEISQRIFHCFVEVTGSQNKDVSRDPSNSHNVLPGPEVESKVKRA
jgi:putative glutamine amidotransferase